MIGDRLTTLRKHLGFNQIPFAKKIGVSQSAYANYERGVTDIPISLAQKLCIEYQASPAWLLLGEGGMLSNGSGQLVEDAAISVLEVLLEEDIDVKPAKTAQLIRHFFEEMADGNLRGRDEQIRRAKLVF